MAGQMAANGERYEGVQCEFGLCTTSQAGAVGRLDRMEQHMTIQNKCHA